VGRCWTRSELVKLARLCVSHDVILCSDEVWGELPLDQAEAPFISMLALLPTSGAAATTTASAGTERPVADVVAAGGAGAADGDGREGVAGLAERLIVLTSPMKAYNIASMCVGVAVIPHRSLWRRFDQACAACADISCLGFAAAMAAYEHPECEAWRLRVVAYVRANRAYAHAALTSMGIRCVVPEGSYLMWADATHALRPGDDALQVFLAAGVGLSGGVPFGGAPGTFRINLACRRETLEEGLLRMAAAIDERRVDGKKGSDSTLKRPRTSSVTLVSLGGLSSRLGTE
jgi:cystathionine beta-lyase